MKIFIIEPYFTGSHAAWANGYAKHSRHQVEILNLSGQFWKWRMHGGAITLAEQFLKSKLEPDLILATDMLDITTFLSLTRTCTSDIPIAIYFHENQLCYPWSPDDRDIIHKRDKHYGFINYTSTLAANAVFFNSEFHSNAFFEELHRFLKHFPDHRGLENIERIRKKSQVLHLGLDLKKFDQFKIKKENSGNGKIPLVLWNHRWEYDKNPADFFNALIVLAEQGLDFNIAVLGENFSNSPVEFENAQKKLGGRIVQFGFAETFEQYANWLWQADIIPVTSNQDFFGASVVEAIYCGCFPLLPNRLAFPEIIPVDKYADNFYNNFDELVEKLAGAICDIQQTREQDLSPVVEKYCWEKMAPYYDEVLESL